MHRSLAAALCLSLALPATALAETPPQFRLQASSWSNGAFHLEVTLATPPNRYSLVLGGPKRKWCDAISLALKSVDGKPQRWPLQADTACASTIVLSDNRVEGGVTWRLTAAQVKRLKPGTYEAVATLDLTGAGGGDFQGTLTSDPEPFQIGKVRGPPPHGKLPSTPAGLISLLQNAKTSVQRRELALVLDGLLLDAPELPPGPDLDAVVAAHLKELTRQLCTSSDVYGSGDTTSRVSNALLF
jgi:hypothetical protein